MSKYLKFKTPATDQAEDLKSRYGLENHGLTDLDRVYWNLPEPALYEEASFRQEGKMAHGGPLVVNTGKWSARAAQDKYIVKEASTEDAIKFTDLCRKSFCFIMHLEFQTFIHIFKVLY